MKDKHGLWELRVYEFLGIKLFRALILCFERIKHTRDKQRNRNYHPETTSPDDINRFKGYVLYNTALHIISLVITAVYFALTRILRADSIVFDVIMIAVTVFNIYCIMLQRYIYLTLRRYTARWRGMRQRKLESGIKRVTAALQDCDADKIGSELKLIARMRSELYAARELVLGADDAETLEGIAQVCDTAFGKRAAVTSDTADITLGELIGRCGSPEVTTRSEKRASRLQSMLGVKGSARIDFDITVITLTADVEAAYRRIFTSTGYTAVLLKCDMLFEAYLKAVKL